MILGAAPIFEVKLQERRRFERFELALPGRCMLYDRLEYPCWTIDVSPAGVGIIGLHKGDIGERIVAYISQIGRIEGMIARRLAKGFALEIQAPALKREKLAQRIAWLVKRETIGAPDERRHERISPENQQTKLRTPDGREYLAELIDVSVPGAALNVDAAPPIGSPVTIGRTSARVVRHFPGGIAVSFNDQLPVQVVEEDAKL
ncbi:MAG: PilZ domain-containing protein [Roseiarcus sp.]